MVKANIVPCLWFNDDGEEAAAFYVSLFEDGAITSVSRYGDGAPLSAGTAMTINFQLAGREYMILNGGPVFQLSEAFSFMVTVETQAEIDFLWESLTANGGEESMCAWLKDRWGVSWQIVPTMLGERMGAGDPAKSGKMMEALLQMKKLDIAALQAAYDAG